MSVSEIDLDPIRWSNWSENPYPLYRALRDEHPIFHDQANDEYLLTRYEDVSALLLDNQRFSNVPLWVQEHPENQISPLREADQPQHTWLRAIVAPLFTPKEMRRLEPYFKSLADELLDAAEQADVVNASSMLGIPLPGRVTCDLLGVPKERHKLFMDLTAERLGLLSQNGGYGGQGKTFRPFEAIRADLWDVIDPVVAARRLKPENDAISLLIQAQDRLGVEQLSNDLIVDMLLHLLTGGFHTTQHLIEMFVSLMADRDDLWQRLRADRSLVNPAIEELLRWDSPVQAQPRRAVEDTESAGVPIPKDAKVYVVYGSANRDEREFEDADAYSLDRGVSRHFAFSTGVHFCPGQPVTRFEVRALINAMLDRYRAIERMGPSVRWLSEQATVHAMHGYKSVPVKLIPN